MTAFAERGLSSPSPISRARTGTIGGFWCNLPRHFSSGEHPFPSPPSTRNRKHSRVVCLDSQNFGASLDGSFYFPSLMAREGKDKALLLAVLLFSWSFFFS